MKKSTWLRNFFTTIGLAVFIILLCGFFDSPISVGALAVACVAWVKVYGGSEE